METKAQEARGALGTELGSEASPTDTAHEAPAPAQTFPAQGCLKTGRGQGGAGRADEAAPDPEEALTRD